MDAQEILVTVLIAAGIVVCGFAVFALTEAVSSLRSVRRLADDLDGRLVPLIEKAEVTVDAVNAELLRIDGIVTQFQEVSDRVSSTTSAVHDVVNAPREAVNAVGSRLRQAWLTARRARRH